MSYRAALSLVIILCFDQRAFAEPAKASDPAVCVADTASYLDRDYWTFDQHPVSGWRAIADVPGCELAAADLIADYHAGLREKGEPVTIGLQPGMTTPDGDPVDVDPDVRIQISSDGEVFLLYWHEGQIRAFGEQTQEALDLFRKSIKPADQNSGDWNSYVLGSIAFLEGDRSALEKAAQIVARWGENRPNYKVLDRLLNCFGESYRYAYAAAVCQSEMAD